MDYLYELLDSEELYRLPSDFKDRFAKLTLSKKKHLRKSLEANLLQEEKSNQCKELSRTILRELLTDDSSESEAEELNKIFKSTSSSLISDKNVSNKIAYKPKKLSLLLDEMNVLESEEIYCASMQGNVDSKISKDVNNDTTENMEKLELSLEENVMKSPDVEVLSQKVSNLEIYSLKFENQELSQLTQIVSVESERKSSAGLDSSTNFPPLRFETEPFDARNKLEQVELHQNDETGTNLDKTTLTTISVSSVESGDLDVFNTDEEVYEENVIVVSDSENSVSSLGEPPKKPSDVTDNYSDQISEIRPSGQTLLTNTLSNEKADRIEAFLKNIPINNELYGFDNTQNSILTKSTDESNSYSSIVEESLEVSGTSTENEIKSQDFKPSNNTSKDSFQKGSSNFSNYSKTDETEISVNENSNNINESRDNESCESAAQNKYSSSSSNYEYEQISVSAKFNIKIHINSQPSIVIDDNKRSGSSRLSTENESEKTNESRQSEIYQENQKAIAPNSIIETISENVERKVSVENIDEKAKQILTKLYGNQWQTPENIKKLDKTISSNYKNLTNNNNDSSKRFQCEDIENFKSNTVSSEKSKIFKSPRRIIKTPPKLNPKTEKTFHEESSIADFSLFHKNIRNDLESTRLNGRGGDQEKTEEITKPELPFTDVKKVKTKLEFPFRIPQTEKLRNATKLTRAGRLIKPTRCKKLLDMNDSSSDQCSDDSEADVTYQAPLESVSESLSSSCSSEDSNDQNFNLKNKKSKRKTRKKKENDSKIVYLDLSNEVIKVQPKPKTPPTGAHFNEKLDSLLKTSTFQPRKQLDATPSSSTTRRKLFTPKYGDEDEILPPDSPLYDLQNDSQEIKLKIPLPSIFGLPINKKLESVKTGTPIFKISTPTKAKENDKYDTPQYKKDGIESDSKCNINCVTPKTSKTPRTPKSQKNKCDLIDEEIPQHTPLNKYGFLKSLDVMVPKSRCHPNALIYRNDFKSRKEELSQRLYKLYNDKLFKNELNVEIIWNKKLINTAGRCSNKKKGNIRSSVIELSEKVLTSADRLRCTLIHELCHAATWIFNGEHGHGATWKAWAQKANFIFQELPKIGVCHSYDIEYKYTYKCVTCEAKSHAHSKSKKTENIRCAFCHGAIEILLNKKDKDGNIVSTPIKEPTGFAKFVKDNYKNFQKPDLKHGDVMKLLSNEFATLKVAESK